MSELTTRAVELEGGLFVVPKGANKREALLTATCAVNSVKQRLDLAVGEDQAITTNDAWMLSQILEGAQALLEACE